MDELTSEALRLGIDFRRGVSGGSLTTFGSGGKVNYLFEPQNAKALRALQKLLLESKTPYRVIGGGSNLLIDDRGFEGALIRLSRFDRMEREGRELCVGAGVKLPLLARRAATESLSGVEFACGIPGTAGGAAAVNAGAFGQSLSDVLEEVTVLTREGEIARIPARDLGFEYHRATLPQGAILLGLNLCLTQCDGETVKESMRVMNQKRRATQPRQPSAGSVFGRVNGIPAALLIEKTGLKGTRIGGAELSRIHCNFIVNAGGATTADYFALAEKVRKKVGETFGVTPQYEVERICSRIEN